MNGRLVPQRLRRRGRQVAAGIDAHNSHDEPPECARPKLETATVSKPTVPSHPQPLRVSLMGCTVSQFAARSPKSQDFGSNTIGDRPKGARFSRKYKFVDNKELGRGNFAVVRQAVVRKTGFPVAVKCTSKLDLSAEDEAAVFLEVEVLSKVGRVPGSIWLGQA